MRGRGIVAGKREPPRDVDHGEWRGVEQRGTPPSPYEHGQAHDEDHRDRDARAEHSEKAGEQAENVSPVDWAVMVGEDEMREPEDKRRTPRHVDGQEDYL